MKSEDVALYLREHPDFFTHYAEFLERIVPPQNNVVSMAQEKLQEISAQNRRLESKLNELLNYGEENDRTSEKMHQFAVALASAPHWHAILPLVDFHLKEFFQVPFVALRLWDVALPPEAQNFEAFAETPDTFKAAILQMQKPTCGYPNAMSAALWGADAAPRVKSEALIPLKNDGALIGVLALASEDARRFAASQGTLYLTRLGELITAALFRGA